MQILTDNNVVFICGSLIEKGRWVNDPSMDTYRITTESGYQYCVIADFKIYDVDSIPSDYEPNKFCYTEEQGFYPNPEYVVDLPEQDIIQ